jgi:hypothetical protein
MADDPNKRGPQDRSKVSQQPHEVNYLVKKFDLPKPLVKDVIDRKGPSRPAVEEYLKTMKDNGKKK